MQPFLLGGTACRRASPGFLRVCRGHPQELPGSLALFHGPCSLYSTLALYSLVSPRTLEGTLEGVSGPPPGFPEGSSEGALGRALGGILEACLEGVPDEALGRVPGGMPAALPGRILEVPEVRHSVGRPAVYRGPALGPLVLAGAWSRVTSPPPVTSHESLECSILPGACPVDTCDLLIRGLESCISRRSHRAAGWTDWNRQSLALPWNLRDEGLREQSWTTSTGRG